VSTVCGYGLDDRAIEVRSPAVAKYLSSSLCVQIGSGAYPASCPMGTGGPFPGVKRGRGVMLTTHPQSSAEVVNEQELYLHRRVVVLHCIVEDNRALRLISCA
jgi:hypothetical protein